jgi:hypothetical protein
MKVGSERMKIAFTSDPVARQRGCPEYI